MFHNSYFQGFKQILAFKKGIKRDKAALTTKRLRRELKEIRQP